MSPRATLPVLAAFVLAAGCHSVTPVEPLRPPQGHVEERLAFGGVLGTYAPSLELEKSQKPAVDRCAISKTIADLLAARGLFEGVETLAPADGPETVGGGERGWAERAQKTRRAAVKALAERSKTRLALEVDAMDARVRYVGQSTPLLIWKAIVLLGALPFPDIPNWFVSSDHFELSIWATCRLVDGHDGTVLEEKIVEGKSDGWFGDFSRGFFYYSFLFVPGCLDDEDWLAVVNDLRPNAERAVAQACVAWAEDAALERANRKRER